MQPQPLTKNSLLFTASHTLLIASVAKSDALTSALVLGTSCLIGLTVTAQLSLMMTTLLWMTFVLSSMKLARQMRVC